MAGRKDRKGRVLKTGESQRTDGKYVYQYMDAAGNRKSVYAWRLTPSDATPPGKRKDLSLREKEKLVRKDLDDNIAPAGGNLTVLGIVERYVAQKKGVRHNTVRGYAFVRNLLQQEEFAGKRIDRVRLSDARAWFIKLREDGRGYHTVQKVHDVLRPAFQMAVTDDLVRKNPFDFQLAEVVANDSRKREAVTEGQERDFLDFIRADGCFSKYYDAVYILFHTGMRISEFCGLTLPDIDFADRRVSISRQLLRTGHMEYYISATKTASGTRQLPVTDKVCGCFRNLVKNRKRPDVEMVVDGHTGFLCLDRNGNPMVNANWERIFRRMVDRYNRTHEVRLPQITPHVCRHTYCSNMARAGMNPKTLQYLMGHSRISVTLDVYTHMGLAEAEAEILYMQEKENSGGMADVGRGREEGED